MELTMAQAIVKAACAIGAGFCMGVGACGPAIGEGNAVSHALDGMARQPEAAGNIRSSMIIALALMEALTIYGLLIAFMLIGKM